MNSTKQNTKSLKNEKVNIKLKLSALWIAVMFCYAYGDILGFFSTEQIEDILAGNMGPLGPTSQGVLLGVAIFMSIPALMVFLSLILKPKKNRWINIILGVIYTVAVFITLFMDPWPFYIYLGIMEMGLTLLIIWYAWKWPYVETHM